MSISVAGAVNCTVNDSYVLVHTMNNGFNGFKAYTLMERVIRTLDNSQLSFTYAETMFISSFWAWSNSHAFYPALLWMSRYRRHLFILKTENLLFHSNVPTVQHLCLAVELVCRLNVGSRRFCAINAPCLQPVYAFDVASLTFERQTMKNRI